VTEFALLTGCADYIPQLWALPHHPRSADDETCPNRDTLLIVLRVMRTSGRFSHWSKLPALRIIFESSIPNVEFTEAGEFESVVAFRDSTRSRACPRIILSSSSQSSVVSSGGEVGGADESDIQVGLN